MPGIEVPFRAPTPILFFVITILAAYFSFEPPTALARADADTLSEALRLFAWTSAWFFVATGPLSWLKGTLVLLSTSNEPIEHPNGTLDTIEVIAQWGHASRIVLSSIQFCGYTLGTVVGFRALAAL